MADSEERLPAIVVGSVGGASSVSVSVVATIGGVTVTDTRAFTIEWLASVELELYYQDGSTSYTSSELRHRYACSTPTPTVHSLRVRTYGTLSAGRRSALLGSGGRGPGAATAAHWHPGAGACTPFAGSSCVTCLCITAGEPARRSN